MNSFPWLLDMARGEQIGWTLLHSLWQIAAVAAFYAVASLLLRHSTASARYRLGCAALTAMAILPLATFVHLAEQAHVVGPSHVSSLDELSPLADGTAEGFRVPERMPTAVPAAGPDAMPDGMSVPVASQTNADEPAAALAPAIASVVWNGWKERARPVLRWLAGAWLAGVALFALRLLIGLAKVRRLRSRGLSPLPAELSVLAGELMARLGVLRAVEFVESSFVQVPTLIGYLRPMVLLPASALTGLSTQELELILAHELAHIRRHDYLVNLLQTLVETILFYHPGMWWVSADVRKERENCCDDIAVALCGNRGLYVRALLALEQQRSVASPALAASGGSLVERVRRLTRSGRETRLQRASAWLAGLIVFAALGVFSLSQTLAQRSDESPRPDQAVSNETKRGEASIEVAQGAAEPAQQVALQPAGQQPGPQAIQRDVNSDAGVIGELRVDGVAAGATKLLGRVLYDGDPPKQEEISTGTLYWNGKEWVHTAGNAKQPTVKGESLIVGKDRGIANVVIWVRTENIAAPPVNAPPPAAKMRAENERFDPHVLAYWNAAPLRWVNKSDSGINFNWSSSINTHNRALKPGEQVEIRARPERVPSRITCNIKPWMNAYVLPLLHPYFAVTGEDGRFAIKNLPQGQWKFGIWHERSGWLATDRFPTGRFDLKIAAGENNLGDLRVEPDELDAPPTRTAGGDAATMPVEAERSPERTVNPDINKLDDGGFTKLHRVSSGGQLSKVIELLAAGADVNARQATFQGTPLQYAANQGHDDVARKLLEHGAKVDARDTQGRTPLMWAAKSGFPEVVRVLLDAGADVNAANEAGWTALHFAAEQGNPAASQLLVSRGANIAAKNTAGQTPFDLAMARKTGGGKPLSLADIEKLTRDPYPELGVVRDAGKGWHLLRIAGHDRASADMGITRDQQLACKRLFEIYQEKSRQLEDSIRKERGQLQNPEWNDRNRQQWDEAFIEGKKLLNTDQIARVEAVMRRRTNWAFPDVLIKPGGAPGPAQPLSIDLRGGDIRTLNGRRPRADLEPDKVVARVYGRDVRSRELDPPNGGATSAEFRRERLGGLVWKLLLEPYREKEQLDPTDAERKEFIAHVKAGGETTALANLFLPPWKLNRWLYKRYGGRVIAQQLGPEAIDAMRDFLKEHEAKGDFKIHDSDLKLAFWTPYLRENPGVVMPNPERWFAHSWAMFTADSPPAEKGENAKPAVDPKDGGSYSPPGRGPVKAESELQTENAASEN